MKYPLEIIKVENNQHDSFPPTPTPARPTNDDDDDHDPDHNERYERHDEPLMTR